MSNILIPLSVYTLDTDQFTLGECARILLGQNCKIGRNCLLATLLKPLSSVYLSLLLKNQAFCLLFRSSLLPSCLLSSSPHLPSLLPAFSLPSFFPSPRLSFPLSLLSLSSSSLSLFHIHIHIHNYFLVLMVGHCGFDTFHSEISPTLLLTLSVPN